MELLYLPVLVDHVCDAKPSVDDLAPTVTVKELGAELRSGQVPRAGVCEGGVLVNGGDFLASFKELLESKEMSVNTLAIRCSSDVLDMGVDGLAEKLYTCLVVNGGIRPWP